MKIPEKSSEKTFNWRKELRDIALLGLLGGLVTSIPFCMDCGWRMFFINYGVSACYWIFLAKGNGYIVDWLDLRLSWVDQPIRRFAWGVLLMLIYTLVVAYSIYLIVVMTTFDRTLGEAIANIPLSTFLISISITLIISLFLHGRSFLFNWRDALVRIEKLRSESLNFRYEMLKNQVNPHFLFNSLNVLSSLVYDDQDKAAEFIRKLSHVYRYVLDKRDQELVSLKEELDFARNYVFLQKIRFGESLMVELPKETPAGYLPPLALQVLLENAIKHNVVSEKKPLRVRVELIDSQCVVTNNVQERLEKDSTGIGLSNLRDRYEYLTNQKLEIIRDAQQFRVILPILTLENNSQN